MLINFAQTQRAMKKQSAVLVCLLNVAPVMITVKVFYNLSIVIRGRVQSDEGAVLVSLRNETFWIW